MFQRWARFILPRVTGKCTVRARAPTRNLSKSSKHFSSRTTSRIGSKSSLCYSTGECLYAGERSAAIRRSVLEISTMVPVTFENIPTMFKQWVRFILPRVTGKCKVRAWAPTRNLRKSSKAFSSRTTRRIGSKSSLCNLRGEALYAGERSTAIRRSVPKISRGRTDRQTDGQTHTVPALI